MKSKVLWAISWALLLIGGLSACVSSAPAQQAKPVAPVKTSVVEAPAEVKKAHTEAEPIETKAAAKESASLVIMDEAGKPIGGVVVQGADVTQVTQADGKVDVAFGKTNFRHPIYQAITSEIAAGTTSITLKPRSITFTASAANGGEELPLDRWFVMDDKFMPLAKGMGTPTLALSDQDRVIRCYAGSLAGSAIIPALAERIHIALSGTSTIRFFAGESAAENFQVIRRDDSGAEIEADTTKGGWVFANLIAGELYRFALPGSHYGDYLFRAPASGQTAKIPVFPDSQVSFRATFPDRSKVAEMVVFGDYDEVATKVSIADGLISVPQSLVSRDLLRNAEFRDRAGKSLARVRLRDYSPKEGVFTLETLPDRSADKHQGLLVDKSGEPVAFATSTTGVTTDAMGRFETTERSIRFEHEGFFATGFLGRDKSDFGELHLVPPRFLRVLVTTKETTSFRVGDEYYLTNAAHSLALAPNTRSLQISVEGWQGHCFLGNETKEIRIELSDHAHLNQPLHTPSDADCTHLDENITWNLRGGSGESAYSGRFSRFLRSDAEARISVPLPTLGSWAFANLRSHQSGIEQWGLSSVNNSPSSKAIETVFQLGDAPAKKNSLSLAYGARRNVLVLAAYAFSFATKEVGGTIDLDELREIGGNGGRNSGLSQCPGGWYTSTPSEKSVLYVGQGGQAYSLLGNCKVAPEGFRLDLDSKSFSK